MRRWSGALRSSTIPLSLTSFISSQFFLSRLSYLSARGWSVVENSLSPIMSPISLLLARSKLRYLSLGYVTLYSRPRPAFLTRIVLKFHMMSGRDFYFLKKRQGKKIPEEASLLAWTRVLCLSLHFAKRSIIIGLHKPLWRNSPGYISPPFWWLYKTFLPLRRSIFEPIIFGFIIPNKTTHIVHTHANLKPVTQDKIFTGWNIIWVHNQNAFWRFMVISTTRAKLC